MILSPAPLCIGQAPPGGHMFSLFILFILSRTSSSAGSYSCLNSITYPPGFLLPGTASSTSSLSLDMVRVLVSGRTFIGLVYRSVRVTCTSLGMYHSVWLFRSSVGSQISTFSSSPPTLIFILIISSFWSSAFLILTASLSSLLITSLSLAMITIS